MSPALRLAALLGAAMLALPGAPRAAATAEAWITDDLQAGIHEAASRESPVLALVPSATPLEVLGQGEGVVQVRTPEGVEGWVDASLVTLEMPAELIVAELEAWKQSREEELAAAWAEVEALRAQLEAAGPDAVAAGAALAELREEKRRLEARLAEAMAALEAAEAAAPALGDPPPAAFEPPGSGLPAMLAPAGRWVPAILAGVALLLFTGGFGAGAWLVDRAQRRRHGGFRL
jgi:SH3 domain protein